MDLKFFFLFDGENERELRKYHRHFVNNLWKLKNVYHLHANSTKDLRISRQ